MKKVFLVFLSVLLVATMLPLGTVMAADSAPTVLLNKVIVKPDSKTVTLTLSLQDNPGIICGSVYVEAPDGFVLDSWNDTGLFGEYMHYPNKPFNNPYKLVWANDLAPENYTNNGDLITLTYLVGDAVAPGTYEFKLNPTGLNDDFVNYDLKVYLGTRVNGAVSVPEVIKNSEGAITDIVVPEGAVAIDDMTFRNLPDLKTVTIPDTVVEIDENAFAESPDVVIKGGINGYAKNYADSHDIPFNEVSDSCGWLVPTAFAVGAAVVIALAVVLILKKKKPEDANEVKEEDI